MAAVIFACGTKARVPERDALLLAGLLAESGTVAGFTAAWKIYDEAWRQIGQAAFGSALALENAELAEIAAALDGAPGELSNELARLRDDASHELVEREMVL